MKHFFNKKIMNHCRRSEQQKRNGAGRESQTELSPDSHNDVCPKPRPVTQKSCPGSQNAPENMYVLKNCDRCQDYTVQPCNKGCKCPKRGTQCDGQCDISDHEKSQVQSQESFPEAVTPRTKMTQPSKTSLDPALSYRKMGGNCPICQLCGQEEIRQPGQSMCPNCNDKIQAAVGNYYVQCQGQCQQGTGQPCPYQQDQAQTKAQQPPPGGHWQHLNGSPYDAQQQQQQLGEQPFNIIVLQDCNNHALIDQLTTAINRGGGQMHAPVQNNNYRNSYSNQPHNFQNNPLTGYLDYEYLDLNRKGYGYEHERDDRYDYGYDMGPWPMDPYYRDGYEEERYPHSSSCNSYDCPAKNDIYPKQDPWHRDQTYEENLSPMDNGQSNSSNCNCDCCKGGDTKDKLALLIAQALEIFISSTQCKQEKEEQNQKHGKVKQSEEKGKKQKKRGRRSTSADRKSTNVKVEYLLGTSKSSKARLSALATPDSKKPNGKGESLFGTAMTSRAKLSAVPSLFSKTNSVQSTKRAVNPISKDSSINSSVDVANVGSRYKEVSNRNEKPPFFLPNCEEHRCKNDCQGLCSRKPHDCDRGCKSICRGPCSKSGGGDGRSRSKASGRKNRPQHRHARCQQCNQGEGRQWQEVGGTTDCPDGTNTGAVSGAPGCAGCGGGGKDRNTGGGKNTLLGLSPIAHYRPGMLKFPVNYLLAGTNCRRSLVRTAAGVTLHQKPYVDMAEAKDLPDFPCRKKSSSPDCRTPAKKWL